MLGPRAYSGPVLFIREDRTDAERQMRPRRCPGWSVTTDTRIVRLTASGSYGIWNANRPTVRKETSQDGPHCSVCFVRVLLLTTTLHQRGRREVGI